MFDFDVPPRLLSDVARFDRDDLLIKLAGISLTPLYQDNHLRIFTLVQLVLARAVGKKRASTADIAALLNALMMHDSGRNEDPSEDVFVTTVTHPEIGDLRIFLGNFPGSDLHLQRMLNAFIENSRDLSIFVDPCVALLRLSEAIADRCEVAPGAMAIGELYRKTWPRALPPLVERGQNSCFDETELAELGIDPALLEPFFLTEPEALLDSRCGENEFMARPLISVGGKICLPVPSLVSPAIRLFLAQIVAEDRALARDVKQHLFNWLYGRWLIYDFPMRGHRPLETSDLPLEEPDFTMFGDYAHTVLRFDEDKAAHLIMLGADWSDPPAYALHGVRPAPANFTPNFNSYVRECATQLRDEFARGLTIVVHDSPGWNIDFEVVAKPGDGWYVAALPSSALVMLLADPNFDLLALWKMQHELWGMRDRGLRVGFYPDLINFWAIWRELGNSFRVPGVDLEEMGGVTGDTGAIQPWVAAQRAFRGAHGAQAGAGDWERVERYLKRDAPPEELSKPIFFQPLAIVADTMRYVVQGDGTWWVSTARPPFSSEDYHFLYLLWQTTSEWMLRLQQHPLNPLAGSLPCFELRLLPVPKEVVDGPAEFRFEAVDGYPVLTLLTPSRLIDDMATPGNEGEVELVDAIAQAAVIVSGLAVPEADRRSWVEAVTADPALKMMHVTFSADAGLAVDLVAVPTSFRPLDSHDLIAANVAARACLLPELPPEDPLATDDAMIQALLRKIVDGRWKRCKALLAELDRTQTLRLAMRQVEAALRERTADARGALARSRFYSASLNDGWTINKIGERDAAYRCYRVLAEMAVCECPIMGGRNVGQSDLDLLAAEIFHLVANAEYSDAVKYNLVPGRLEFLPDGSLSSQKGGATIAMPDYLRASLREVVDVDADSYAEHFEMDREQGEGDEGASEEAIVKNAFHDAYLAEMGISLVDSVRVSLALQAVCVERPSYVIELRRSEVVSAIEQSEPPATAEQLDSFLRVFGLATRAAWDAPGQGFTGADIWPWLFERRLSLMLRPVLIVDESDDPLLIFGVRQLELSTQYAAHLLEEAAWTRDRLASDEAKRFHDRVVAQRGVAFETEVATLASSAGWRIVQNIPMKQLGAKGLGEIDVLAVDEDTGTWVVIECKWFGQARTAREVMNWMQGFHGKGGDKLDHHLKRVEWVEENREQAASRIGLATPSNVVGWVVTTRPVPLGFAAQLPPGATTVTKRQFNAALSELKGRARTNDA